MSEVSGTEYSGPAAWRRRVATIAGGVLLGLAALAFARLADGAQELFERIAHPHLWLIAGAVPFLFMLVSWVTMRWFAGSRGSGIPQVIALVSSPEQAGTSPYLKLPVVVAKTVLTSVMLLAGAAVGREGPTVQLAAALNVAVHRWLRVPITSGVVIAGGAAGVAAAFNTPLAGVAFAIEELAAAYEQRMAALVMMAVMIAGLVSLGIAGDYVYLGAVHSPLPFRVALVVTPIAGIAGGVCGGLFSRAMLFALKPGQSLLHRLRSRPVLFAGACGAIVAAMGVLSHGSSWGTGYATTRELVEGVPQAWWMIVPRAIATIATAVSGAPGGIFAPSLSVGAELGNVLAHLLPGTPLGPVVLLGMIAYFTGVVRAPLTAVVIIAEATGSHQLVIPLFASALIADAASGFVAPEKLYHGLSLGFVRELKEMRAAEEVEREESTPA
ncbi:chloride channel protein [Sphingomonas sp. AP4-R1]|nr:chloride channel protein [Sphingomonas sp. AP4-R1]